MIVTAVLTVLYGLLNLLLSFSNLPQFPDTITTLLHEVVGYIGTGIDILRSFVGDTAMGVMALCLQLIIYMNVTYFIWSFAFFIIRKIPFFNVKE